MNLKETGHPQHFDPREALQYDRYVSADETRKVLEELGYGPTKMFVEALYIHKDGNKAVGVLNVTEEHARDHFGVFRGVDHVEAVGQTILALQYISGKIPEGKVPTLKSITIDSHNVAFPGSVLNIAVTMNDPEGDFFSGKGTVFSRGKIISEVGGVGRMIDKDLLDRMISRERDRQDRNPPLFPLKG